MKPHWSACAFLVAVCSATAIGQVRPRAIAGVPTSGRHCVAGNAARVHNLGWVDAQTGYAITFDADFEVLSAVVRLDLAGRSSAAANGPEFNRTASTPGTMILLVAPKEGQRGCYSYKAALTPPSTTTSTSVTAGIRSLDTNLLSRVAAQAAAPLAVSGTPSSADYCVSGNYVAGVHDIGRIDRDSRVTVAFDTDFDAIVGVTMNIMHPGGTDGLYAIRDTTGDNRSPSIAVSARAGDNVVVFITGINGAAGCYRYKVQIQ